MSLFTAVEMAPRDPILGLNEQFNADTNPNKVNLGVGVYYDDQGKLPLLQCVQIAEKAMMESPKPRGYLPMDGVADRPGHWRHRRPENWRRFPEKAQPERQGPDQRPKLGEPPRAVRPGRLHR